MKMLLKTGLLNVRNKILKIRLATIKKIKSLISDGDLGAFGKSTACYMKQKHRLIWERRHGKVGTGMKSAE